MAIDCSLMAKSVWDHAKSWPNLSRTFQRREEVECMKKKETEFLTEEEAQAILRVPDRRTQQGKRDYAILLALLTTGLRKAEICNLKVGDLKTYRNQVVIDVIGKGKKFRRIPLHGDTLVAIKDY